jgi:hypothetical protein
VQGHGGCCQNLGQEVENIFERSQRDIVQEVYLTCGRGPTKGDVETFAIDEL